MNAAQHLSIKDFVGQIPIDKQVPGYAYLSGIDVKGAILAMEHVCPVERRMRLMLFQAKDAWACVAEVPLQEQHGHVAYVRFSTLGFIALWNTQAEFCRIAKAHCRVELLQDVAGSTVVRHPAILPMEIRFDEVTKVFKRKIIYHTGQVGAQ